MGPHPTARKLVGSLLGFLLALGVVAIGDRVHRAAMPPRDILDPTRPHEVATYFATAPWTVRFALPLTWAVAVGLASFVAARIGASFRLGVATGLVLALLACGNALIVPIPIWVSVVTAAVALGAAYFGARAGAAAVTVAGAPTDADRA